MLAVLNVYPISDGSWMGPIGLLLGVIGLPGIEMMSCTLLCIVESALLFTLVMPFY